MRVLIKLSGEGLSRDGEKFSERVLKDISQQIAQLKKQDHEVALVVGGGNLFRGGDLIGTLGIKESTAHYVGMLATVQNALVLRDYFNSTGLETRVSSAIGMPQVCEEYMPLRALRHLEKGRVVIFAAGLGIPFFTTDSCSVQRSLEIQADMLIMSKNGVEGLYTADPATNESAEFIPEITASAILEQNLKFADQSAVALAKENGLPIKVVSLSAIDKALEEGVGSFIRPE
jgi:uridylate kinase